MAKKIRFLQTGEALVSDIYKNGGDALLTLAYDALGKIKGLSGDDSFPFFKDPPEVREAVVYAKRRDFSAVTGLDDYFIGPTVDTRGLRKLVLFFELTDNDSVANIFSILLEGVDGGRQYAAGAISPVIGAGTVPGYSAQAVDGREYQWTPGEVLAGATEPLQFVLPVDVTDYSDVRFRVGLAPGSGTARTLLRVGAVR